MRKFTRVLLLTALSIALLGASGCQDELDEVCDFAKSAVEVTRQILDAADKAVLAAEAGVQASCASFGVDCSEALSFLKEVQLFVVEARSKHARAEFLVSEVCKPDGSSIAVESMTALQESHIRREVKALKSWIVQHENGS